MKLKTVGTVKIKGCLRLVPGRALEEICAVNSCCEVAGVTGVLAGVAGCLLIKIMKFHILARVKMLTLPRSPVIAMVLHHVDDISVVAPPIPIAG